MSLWRRLAPLAPFGGIAVVYALYRRIYDWTQIGTIDPMLPASAWRGSLEASAAVADLGARLVWGLASLALILAFIATVWICAVAIANATTGATRLLLSIGALVLTGVGIASGLADNPLTLPRIAETLDDGFQRMALPDGAFLLRFSNGLGMGAAILLAFAAAAILTHAGRGRDRVVALRQRAVDLRRVLVVGAAVLIAGSTTGAAMHRLPVAHLVSPFSEAFESLAQWTAVAAGSLWTLFLVGIYLPTAAILRHRLAEQAVIALPEGDEGAHRDWIAEQGFDLSPSQQLRRLVVALGPLLSSLPVAAFFEML